MYDLLIIGGGTAGLTAAVLAARLGAYVALVEADATGGECLWTGCVPSKALLSSAHLAHAMRHAGDLGLTASDVAVDFPAVRKHIAQAQEQIAPHDSPERLRSLGIEVISDTAVFTAPRTVRLGSGRHLVARAVLLAVGSRPAVPPVDGLAASAPLTTDDVWALEALPDRLAVLGGGPIGCELGQAFARLGSEVVLIEMADRLLPREIPRASELVGTQLRRDGVDVRTGTRLAGVEPADGGWRLRIGSGAPVTCDRVLVAAGRTPRTAGLGLAASGVATRRSGAIAVDRRLRTSASGVYAAGDVIGHLAFTHVAGYQATVATLNALLLVRRKVSYAAVPWVTFTDPEVARVGLTAQQARDRWADKAVTARIDLDGVDRAVTETRTDGFVELVGGPGDRLVGATVVGGSAGEVIAELAAVIRRRGRIADVYRTVHPYPTYALGVALAAGEHLTGRLLTDRTRRVTRSLFAGLRRLRALGP